MFQAFKKIQGTRIKATSNVHDFIDVGHEIAALVKARISSLYSNWFVETYLAKAVSMIPANDNDALDHLVEHIPQIYDTVSPFQPYPTMASWYLAKLHQAIMDNWKYQKTKMPGLIAAVTTSKNSIELVENYKSFHNCLVTIPLCKKEEWIVAVWPGLREALTRVGEQIENPADYAKFVQNAALDFKNKPLEPEFLFFCKENCLPWLEIARLLEPKYTNVCFEAYFAQ